MAIHEKLLKILADGKYHSGTILGEAFGIGRAAIWKNIQKIEKKYGLDVFAVRGKGYRLGQPLELLDKNVIQQNLSKANLGLLNKFEIFFDIDSTSRYLNTKNSEGARSGYLVLAEQQTQGLGRRGREWVSPFACNLYLSLLWRFQMGPAQLSCLSLVVAVAIVRVLHGLGIKDAGVKWPNDILWQGKKVAGILTEMRGEASGPSTVVIGIGLNVSMSKDKAVITDKIDQPWTDIETILKTKIDRNVLTALIVNEIIDVLKVVPDQQTALLEEWQKMDVLKGQNIEVHFIDNPDKVIEGKAMGINQNGALKVRHNGVDTVCYSGEVSLRHA